MEGGYFPAYAIYIFREMLDHPHNTTILVCALVYLLCALVYLLWRVATIILIVFNETFKLLSAALHSPASQVGAGLGGTIGLIVGILSHGSWSARAFGLGVGALLGGLTLNGIHSINQEHSANVSRRELTR